MADPLGRDLRTIGRYSRHNEAEDYRFAGFLKSCEASDAELDTTVREITDAVWAQIDCTTCANCCRTLEIVVDDRDIKRLAKRLKVSPARFAEKYVAVGEDGTASFRSRPCPFLDAENRCTVYEDRPLSCREFPYLYTPGFRQFTLTMIDNNATCPIVFNVWQTLKARMGKRRRSRGRR